MKALLIAAVLALSGCSKELKVGDCFVGIVSTGKPCDITRVGKLIVNDGCTEREICTITRVGKFSYENVCADGNTYVTASKDVQQTDCF